MQLILAAGISLAVGYALKNYAIDDAFIYFSYAKNIANGHWGMVREISANSTTSSLNTIILAILNLITHNSLDSAAILFAGCSFIAFVILLLSTKSAQKSSLLGVWCLWIVFILNPLYISCFGMESGVFIMLLFASYWLIVIKKHLPGVLVASLLVFTRPEGLIYASLFIYFSFHKNRIKALGLFLVIPTIWFLFSWILLGAIISDSWFIKTDETTWGHISYYNGLMAYLKIHGLPVMLSLSFFLPGLGLVFQKNTAFKRNIIWPMLLATIINYAGYSILNVAAYHWYYIPVLFSLFILISYQALNATRICNKSWFQMMLTGLAALHIFYFCTMAFKNQHMPIITNWGKPAEYKDIGLWLNKNLTKDSVVSISGEVGTIVYYSDRILLDHFSHRGWIVDRIESSRGISKLLYKLNYFFFEPEPIPPSTYKLFPEAIPVLLKENPPDKKCIKSWRTRTNWLPTNLKNVRWSLCRL